MRARRPKTETERTAPINRPVPARSLANPPRRFFLFALPRVCLRCTASSPETTASSQHKQKHPPSSFHSLSPSVSLHFLHSLSFYVTSLLSFGHFIPQTVFLSSCLFILVFHCYAALHSPLAHFRDGTEGERGKKSGGVSASIH